VPKTERMDGSNLHRVAPVLLICQECEVAADEFARGWRTYLADDPDDANAERVMATYCPDCAVREFGRAGARSSESHGRHA
jgi:hypothetical protein